MSRQTLVQRLKTVLTSPNVPVDSATEYVPIKDIDNAEPQSPQDEQSEGLLRRRNETEDDGDDEKAVDEPGDAPTEEDLATLPRVSDRIPLAAFTIVLVELCERFAFYGLAGVFQNYLQNPLPAGGNGAGAPSSPSDAAPAGALGLGQSRATALQTTFAALAYVFPILGAIIADTRWGRYKTIVLFCGIYFVGLVIVTVSALPASLRAGLGLPGWIIGVVAVALGTGGIKANVAPLVADQYRRTTPFVSKNSAGQRVIVDPSATLTRIYSLFYWCINVGSLAGIITTQLERRVGFWAAFLLPTVIFLGTPFVLVLGSKLYYLVPPQGSVLVEVWGVIRTAMRGCFSRPNQFLREVRKEGLWERASREWDAELVSSVARTFQACQILPFLPFYWLSYNQLGTNLISMAGTLTTHGLPNDLLQNADPIALLALIPVFDFIIYPALRKRGYGRFLRPIVRIWAGFMCGALAMAYTAVLQYWIYRTNPCGEYVSSCATPSSISVWVQVPSYVLVAVSEIFTSITGLEYAYSQAPERMKSVVMSFFLLTSTFGNILTGFVSPFARDPFLVRMYTGVTITTFIAGNLLLWCFWNRDDGVEGQSITQKEELENLNTDSDSGES